MWFSGSVNEAVATTKQKSVVLVVFVSGNDEASASALSWLENEEVQKCLRENSTVNLKLESKSETAAQFAQISAGNQFMQKEMKKSEDSKIDEPKNEPRAKIRMPKEKKDQEALSRIRQQIAADRLEKSEKYHREQDDKLLRKRKATTEQKVIPAKTKE
ncbi:unnamed protein product [Soboliphyme baturini]|uniref:UBX domain-containing protein n=1 Tax=Soboliphyme baturini TaxID=241478 RepID=A0A183IIU2_9BILA|nr:unnamed protein product [Soboliphyme baturini]